jgi:peptidoglycan hydrolase-like protein with peptidoglycan-binding domain
MDRVRAALAALLVLASGTAGCSGEPDDGAAAPAATTSTTATTTTPPTTTSVPPTTQPPPPPTTAPPTTVPAEPEVLERRVGGPRTQALQQRLADLHFDPGPIDGDFGAKTQMAVWGFQKIAGLPADGRVGPATWQALQAAGPPAPMRPDGPGDRVEVDLARQVMFVFEGGALRLVTHISTGTGREYCDNGHCGVAVTPTGDFDVYRRIEGWHESPLGQLYNPLYFKGGWAIHGAPSVPNHPASHGCVRVPMHIAEYLPGLVANGEPVFVQ